ncbi:CBO0543 family protein [Aquibacillus sediminis]|uniref:CBO0543 family protein n=1 Tax=Aquibacillus sediminis TaxID=2574734 RepID=UPI00110A07B4|nr:CBO0543 family protein [Aquibacillus sediminis]
MKEKVILNSLSILGIVTIPYAINKSSTKEGIIAFLLKAFLSTFFGNIIASKKILEFPIRQFPNAFKSSVLFDMILFPLLCVFYNQTTYRSNLFTMIVQAFLYSTPITIIETYLERRTRLIRYNSWKWYYSLFSLAASFLMIRGMMAYIRKISS